MTGAAAAPGAVRARPRGMALLAGLLALALSATAAHAAQTAVTATLPWLQWQAFSQHFVSPDGRVIDLTGDGRTTSEGQAYALFFALVANDRSNFDLLLRWTEANLAGGSLAQRLPAWHWGHTADGTWKVIDANPASDADLWLAYTLAEAGRLWGDRHLASLARQLAARIAATEVVRVAGRGTFLLPAPYGFELPGKSGWRLNLSYGPPQVLARLAALRMPGPWAALTDTWFRALVLCSNRGYVADWVSWSRAAGWGPDPQPGTTGSYDAIRVYLWAAMLDAAAAPRKHLLASLDGPLRAWRAAGTVPEKVDVASGACPSTHCPVGFLAALAPMVQVSASAEDLGRLRAQLQAQQSAELYGKPPAYYDNALALFGLGFVDGRFRFGADGRLLPSWAPAAK